VTDRQPASHLSVASTAPASVARITKTQMYNRMQGFPRSTKGQSRNWKRLH